MPEDERPKGRPPSLAQLQGHREEIRALARAWGARDLRVVGSVARGEGGRSSDLDLLATFPPGRAIVDGGPFRRALEGLLGCPVDLISARALEPDAVLMTGLRPAERARVRERLLIDAVAL